MEEFIRSTFTPLSGPKGLWWRSDFSLEVRHECVSTSCWCWLNADFSEHFHSSEMTQNLRTSMIDQSLVVEVAVTTALISQMQEGPLESSIRWSIITETHLESEPEHHGRPTRGKQITHAHTCARSHAHAHTRLSAWNATSHQGHTCEDKWAAIVFQTVSPSCFTFHLYFSPHMHTHMHTHMIGQNTISSTWFVVWPDMKQLFQSCTCTIWWL